MPFDPVDPRQSFPELERGLIQYWKEEDIFYRSIKNRLKEEKGTTFSFYDGPPFATGLPHYGHILAGTIKDVIPRYQTMKGHAVQRRFGWDCHGLPIENLIEREHGIKSKKEIEEMGVKAFNDLCRASVQRYVGEWRKTVERVGRFVDMDDDYRTMDPDYMESIWWAFHELDDKGLIYEDYKPMHICPHCQTTLSNFEVTQAYVDITDQSVTVKFGLADEPNTFVLAWTTTPWTLPGNLLLAVGADIDYIKVEFEGAHYIVAKDLVEGPFTFLAKEYTVVGKPFKGKTLVGKKYKPLFPYFAEEYKDAFRVVSAEFVSTQEGTGVVHIAPGFGEDDFNLGKKEKLPMLQHVKMDGTFVAAVTDFAGMDVKPKDDPSKADQKVIAFMKEKGQIFATSSYKHSYPHCWRCDTPLLNYATSSWFVKVEDIKEDMLQVNAETTWVPAHLRDGRFGKWLEGARDWAISRNRYWGAPLPIWKCEETGEMEVLCSRDELMAKKPERFTKVTVIRHGQSEGNLVPMYQGRVPGTDLTELGRKQAEAAAKSLKTQHVDAIFTSALARAEQTAAAVSKTTGVDAVTDTRLNETDFGDYNDKPIDVSDLAVIKARRAHKFATNKLEDLHHMTGMEPWEQEKERVEAFLKETLPKFRGKHIVLVTHGSPAKIIKHLFTGEDPVKITHQAYQRYATPKTYYWDHQTNCQMDLHKDVIDDITWPADPKKPDGPVFKRIPDVLDCWFESGSMPYAQSHFPFEFGSVDDDLPPAFPADFIAEGVDQTRGWFYTLTVLSAALFKKPAFRNCVVNGTVLAADGKKMSKKLKNYPDPMEVMDKHGADSVRFALMNSPAVRAEDLRFSEKNVEEALRNVLLPLWNTYAFFVTYANMAHWEPTGSRTKSSHPLDQWITTEVQDLVNRMTHELDSYQLSSTCDELFDTIDALTNWYVRLSRRRFAGKTGFHDKDDSIDMDLDQQNAIGTLYDVLLTITQLVAPFCPFITDAMYLNLTKDDHGSVHLTDWPEVKKLTKEDQALLTRQRMLRSIVSLGLSIRSDKKIKVRQPLAKATVAIPSSLAGKVLSHAELQLLREELNVKSVEIVDDPGSLAETIAMVDARKVGPRLGGRVQDVIKAGKAGDFAVQEDGSVLILEERMSPDEVSIVYRGKEGQDVAANKGVVVSMDTAVTDELKLEGQARDLIRAIQQLRKDSGYDVSDKVTVSIEGADAILETFADMIAKETNVVIGAAEGEPHTLDLDDSSATLRMSRKE